MAKPKIHHAIFSTNRDKLKQIHGKEGDDVVHEYMQGDKFTPEEYVDLLTNKYMHWHGEDSDVDLDSSHSGYGSDYLYNHKHATPENGQKILEHYLQRFKDWRDKAIQADEKPRYFQSPSNQLKDIYENYELPSQTVHSMLDKPEDYGFYPDETEDKIWRPTFDEIKHESIKKEHLYKLADKHPSSIESYLDHPDADEHFINNHVLGSSEALSSLGAGGIEVLANNENLTGGHAQKLLDNGTYSQRGFNKLLDKLPENERDTYLDNVLGITGGRHHNDFDEDELREDGHSDAEIQEARNNWNHEDNWNEWSHGDGHNSHTEKLAANYPNLSDKHAEHIMRNSDNEDSKWNLYHNENIDPKHAIQMYDKWAGDDEHHGYDKDKFLEKLKEENRENSYDDFYEQAREAAEEEYPMSEYLDDYGHEHVTSEVLSNHYEDIHDKVHENHPNDEDWIAENPDHDKQSWTNFEKMKNFAEKNGLETLNGKQIQAAGVDPDDVEGYGFDMDDESDAVDLDSLAEEYQKHAPTIDYRNHDQYNIDEHPEYDDRYGEAEEDYKDTIVEGWKDGSIDTPDDLYESYDESIGDDRWRRESDLMDEHFEQAMDNEDYIPQHVLDNHPDISRIRNERRIAEETAAREKAEEQENAISGFLDQHIPNRTKEHEYGDGQHHHEMLLDYAKENNGKIDMGRMIKLHPNLKDTWKKIFNGKGKLTTEDVEQKLTDLPKNKYAVSYKNWNGMQRTNNNEQVVFRLDHTDDSVAPLKEDEELYNTFKNVQEVSQRSGHPTNANTIAWSRVDTSDPKHWFIDEVQSDFGSSARDYLKKEGANEKADHISKIIDHHKDWRENITNHIIKEAKKHGVERISTHSPESKAAHTGAGKVHTVYKDSYKKIPRKMGFLPTPSTDMPLDDSGRKVFSTGRGSDEDFSNHQNAYTHHKQMFLAHHYNNGQEGAFDDPNMDKKFELAKQHKSIAKQHINRMKQIDPTVSTRGYDEGLNPHSSNSYKEMWDNAKQSEATGQHLPHEHDALLDKPAQVNAHDGHTLDLRPKALRKSLELVDLLIKTEYLYELGLKEGINVSKLEKNIGKIENDLYKGMFKDIAINHRNFKLATNQDKWLKKADLMKGSFQKRNKFKPQHDVNPEEGRKISDWQQDSNIESKQEIDRLEGHGRSRALRKLASLTDVKHLNGEPHYLLHRGMSNDENHKFIESHGNGKTNYHTEYGTINSWTPDHKKASSFSRDYGIHDTANEHNQETGVQQGHAVSAWIPASHIHHYLPQGGEFGYGGDVPNENQYKDEYEVLIHHTQGHHLAHPDYVAQSVGKKDKPDINDKINTRQKNIYTDKSNMKAKALDVRMGKQSYKHTDPKNVRQPSKLAASEKLTLSQDKWFKRARIVKKESLKKGGLKNFVAGVGGAAIMLHGANEMAKPDTSERQPASIINEKQHREQGVEEAPDFKLKNNMLYSFKTNPITNNKFMNTPQRHGDYSLHENTIKDTVRQNQGLRSQYKHILNMHPDELAKEIKTNPYMDRRIAVAHWDNLQQKFGNKPDHIAHAWYHGPKETKKQIDLRPGNAFSSKKGDLSSHHYVSRIMKDIDK